MLEIYDEDHFYIGRIFYSIPDMRYQYEQLRNNGRITGANIHTIVGYINIIVVNYQSLYFMSEKGYEISDEKRETVALLLQEHIDKLQTIGFCF